ncbi:RING finger protein 39-like [Melopsittacus undulatus]|uniref:RING finger protein 39-like n=1 Tax=Melopsittacus undulatus TaxID=13146 RepID=UPI00146E2997|nr:RING finger protein 39-like [Melopsittacus undulatus]
MSIPVPYLSPFMSIPVQYLSPCPSLSRISIHIHPRPFVYPHLSPPPSLLPPVPSSPPSPPLPSPPSRLTPPVAAHASMSPPVPPERGPLARLARDTQCPACGQALRDPVLLPCNHSCCRRCLRSAGAAVTCPRCQRSAAPHRLRTAVALAVETRIAQRLARGTPAAPRRPQRRSLGAQLRADATAPPEPPTA